jgi:uncharacterized repeat protein (TIGR03803 family)
MPSKKPSATVKVVFSILATLLLASIATPSHAQAPRFKVLHTFDGTNGGSPVGVLVIDASGNIYGTTVGGGTGTCNGFGCGTVFKLNKAGEQVWLYSFQGANGNNPEAGLLRDTIGNLFGTTLYGGDTNCNPPYGCGTVFRLSPTGNKEAVRHKFTGTPDGWFPEAPLVEDPAGNMYGTSYLGGTSSVGAVFKIDATGKETILHSFAGPPDGGGDGAYSYDGVIRDAAGNLYGVTFEGGLYGAGVVYMVDPSGNETLLYSFAGGSGGANPDSVLLLDSQGNLYGTAENGGNSECGGTGCGVIFELSPQSGGGWSETVLYAFCSLLGCADGEGPVGPLTQDSSGNLYGVTAFGGKSSAQCNGTCGVVFKLDPTGKETVLHNFIGGPGGSFPSGGLTIDTAGSLYGVAEYGGGTCYTSYTCGVVFKIAP